MESAAALIDPKIQHLGDWRGKTLQKVRAIIYAAPPTSWSKSSGEALRPSLTAASLPDPSRLLTHG